jgi:hypothetical protein
MLDGGVWLTQRSGHLTPPPPPGKDTRYPLYRRLDKPQGRSGRVWEMSATPGCAPRIFQPVVSHYTDRAVPAQHILGVFENCEKLLLASSCPSVCPHGTLGLPLDGFWQNLMFKLFFFSKICRKIQVSLKSDKIDGYFTWRFHIYDNISLNSS